MSVAKHKEIPDVLEAFKDYEHFCKTMLDAYVVVNASGQIVKSNQLFSALTGKKSKQILKAETFDELLNLTIDGSPYSIHEILSLQAPTRIDEVRGETEEKNTLNLILGIYPFLDNTTVLGAFVLLRDVTAETHLQDKYKVKATQSITDKLTGLFNRTYFEQYLPATLKNLAQKDPEEQVISLIMADIDHFKMVNDTYGHQAGDYVLAKVAKTFRHNFRKTDVLCRYGGEEFLAILPSSNLEGALSAAEKLRESIAHDHYEYNGVKIPVTISLGLAQIQVGKETGEEAIARADSALYHAKKNGRNRVSIHKGGDKIE